MAATASPEAQMPPPLTFPSVPPSPGPDRSAFRPSSRSSTLSESHPYAIKSSSSAVLTRTNSTGHNHTKVPYYYTPASPSSPSRILNNPHARGHRHSKSMSSSMPPPSPLPVPPSPSTPARFARGWDTGNISDGGSPRLKRSETLPSMPTKSAKDIKIADLPENPKLWTPTHLAVYLSYALRAKGAERLPDPVAKDIAAFVIKDRLSGRVFLRLTEEDLEEKGINRLWRDTLLSASRVLRKKALKGRIWGFGNTPEPETVSRRQPSTVDESVEQDSDPELSLDKVPVGGFRRGRVRGMVESFERSGSSASSSGSSAGNRSPIDLDFDVDLAEIDTNDEGVREELRAAGLWDSDSQDDDAGFVSAAQEMESPGGSESESSLPAMKPNGAHKANGVDADGTSSEPSMEELLARDEAADKHGETWGARAWEIEADAGGTARRVTTTLQAPRRSLKVSQLPPTSNEAPLTELFDAPAETTNSVPIIAMPIPPEREQEPPAPKLNVVALMDAFRKRLEEVERRLEEMEKRDAERDAQRALEREQRAQADAARTMAAANSKKQASRAAFLTSTTSLGALVPRALGLILPSFLTQSYVEARTSSRDTGSDTSDDSRPNKTQRRVKPKEHDAVNDLTPAALPSYVLLVSLGVCAVVLRVLLRKVSGRKL